MTQASLLREAQPLFATAQAQMAMSAITMAVAVQSALLCMVPLTCAWECSEVRQNRSRQFGALCAEVAGVREKLASIVSTRFIETARKLGALTKSAHWQGGIEEVQERRAKSARMAIRSIHRLTLRVRKRLPEGLRRFLRLARHVVTTGQSSSSIPSRLLVDCKVCASRHELVRLLPSHGRVAEVGTYRGDFAMHILSASDPAELHLVDLDFTEANAALSADCRVVMHLGTSHEVLASFPDAHFDWIYIDADHSYRGVTRDANAAASKVKPGGFLVFNDFAHMDPFLGAYGVHRAVVDFAVMRGWHFTWLAYDPRALYDVALRRPGP